ncbi:MAG TPA: metal-dependent transcriptional regulator [Clostridiales bacterium]|nr:metal-dependent transcriptional regulator [Clostridiales bacterium]
MPTKNHELEKRITPGEEDYLKVLLNLSGGGEIRSSEVADALGITRASVSCMLKRLKDEGYIAKEKYGTVTLTEKGIEKAVEIKKRYGVLHAFFVEVLGVNADTAARDACLLEHLISPESIQSISQHLSAHERNTKLQSRESERPLSLVKR